ncbi:hypothetical protein IZ6_07420 [Terrihabitans soli]|uniref:Uncharacterized protein n=1 Tax=Terrihabitans soli TaxID=708113 RepID=A0A6S6QPY7_9HYPH|nr:hypothetical protein [Terrihabitans soli]BCJ90007.1 hypothetical protein IZ6_07420 [Terrihabitans soli]
MSALSETTQQRIAAGRVVYLHGSFLWNSDGATLRTMDGYYGGVCARDDGGLYAWSMTPPGSVRPAKRGEERTPDKARTAVEQSIAEHRSDNA